VPFVPKLLPVVPLAVLLPKVWPVVPPIDEIDPMEPVDPIDPKLKPLLLVAAPMVWLLQTFDRHSRLQQSELPWQASPFTAQLPPVVPELMPETAPEVAVWPEVVPLARLPEVLAEWPFEEVPLAAAVVPLTPLPLPLPLPLLLLSTRHRPTVSEQLRPVQQVSPLAQLCACSAQEPPVVPLDELLQAANRQRALRQAAIFKTVSSGATASVRLTQSPPKVSSDRVSVCRYWQSPTSATWPSCGVQLKPLGQVGPVFPVGSQASAQVVTVGSQTRPLAQLCDAGIAKDSELLA